MGDGIAKMNDFLRHAAAKDLPLHELLDLKVDAFEACAADSLARGDRVLADAELAAAEHARNAAETERRLLSGEERA